MPRSDEKGTPPTAIALAAIIGGTIIAVAVPCVALVTSSSGPHVFVLALIGLVMGASLPLTVAAKKKG